MTAMRAVAPARGVEGLGGGDVPAQALQGVAVGQAIKLFEIPGGDIQVARGGAHGLVDIFVFEINASREILPIIRHGIPLLCHRPESLSPIVAYVLGQNNHYSRLFYLYFLILWGELHDIKEKLRELAFSFKGFLWVENYHG